MNKAFLTLGLFLFIPLMAQAQAPGTPSFILAPLENRTAEGKAAQFAPTLESALRSSFQTAGFRRLGPAETTKPDFLVKGFYLLEEENLVIQVTVEHLATRRLVAGDMASVFSGLTALDTIKEMAQALATTSLAYHKKLLAAPKTAIPLPEPLIFTGIDGTKVSWAGDGEIGVISGGSLEVPYYPFPSDGRLTVKIEREGYHPRNLEIHLTQESREFPLPELTRKVTQELVVSTALGRLLGLGAAYHHYIDPNNFYLTGEVHLYGQYNGTPGSALQPHLDLWGGLGYYLFAPPEAEVRFFYELQAGLLASPQLPVTGFQVPIDLVISPVGLGLEYRGLRDWPVQLGVKVPYSLGLPGGLLPRSWLLIAGKVPSVSLGVTRQW